MDQVKYGQWIRLINLLQRFEETKQGYKLTGTITINEKADLRDAIQVFKEWIEGNLIRTEDK